MSILSTPYQFLSRLLMDIATRARTQACRGTKKHNEMLSGIDVVAMKMPGKQLDDEMFNILRVVQAGAGYVKEEIAHLMRITINSATFADMGYAIWNTSSGSVPSLMTRVVSMIHC